MSFAKNMVALPPAFLIKGCLHNIERMISKRYLVSPLYATHIVGVYAE
jgi:hypothetical protein